MSAYQRKAKFKQFTNVKDSETTKSAQKEIIHTGPPRY